MKPKRIVLVRHGESEGNVDKMKYIDKPDYSLDLTMKGKQQAKDCGNKLKEIFSNESVTAYVSPYNRTRQTFSGICSTLESSLSEIKMFEDPRIRELDFGHLRHPDMTEELVEERNQYSAFLYRMKDGESGADVYDRVSTFLETLHRDFEKESFGENCLIVTHGITLRVFLMRWFHWTIEEYEFLRNPSNCQIVILERNKLGKYDLVTPLEKRKELRRLEN